MTWLARAKEALADALAELENFSEEQQEASADEPLPQTDYRLGEIVAKLSHYRQRATYAAVGEFLNASAWMVRGWFTCSSKNDPPVVQIVQRRRSVPARSKGLAHQRDDEVEEGATLGRLESCGVMVRRARAS